MSWRNPLVLAVPAVVLLVSVAAGFVHVTLHRPNPPYNLETLWWVELRNNSGREANGQIRGEITESAGSFGE
jgi:hypothetical protein